MKSKGFRFFAILYLYVFVYMVNGLWITDFYMYPCFSDFSNKQDCLPNEVEESKKFQTSIVISIVILGTASVIFFSFYVKLRNTKAWVNADCKWISNTIIVRFCKKMIYPEKLKVALLLYVSKDLLKLYLF